MSGEEKPLLCDSCAPSLGKAGKNEWKLEWTESLTVYTAENPNIKKAAFLLRDAVVLAKSASSFAHTDYLLSIKSGEESAAYSSNGISRSIRRFLINPFVGGFLQLCVAGIVLLSFIEPPSWCREFQGGCQAAMSMSGIPEFYSDDTEAKIQSYYPNTGTMFLTEQQSIKCEWCFVAVFLFHTFLCFGKDEFSVEKFFYVNVARLELDPVTKGRVRSASIFRYIRLLALIFLVKGMCSYSLGNPSRTFCIPLRIILFISYSEGLQREIMTVFELIPALVTVFLGLTMVTAFYGLIGVAAFYNTSEGTLHFSNFIEGKWKFWIIFSLRIQSRFIVPINLTHLFLNEK